MADALVSLLLKTIPQLLLEQANILSEVAGQVKSMVSWLQLMKIFLEETAKKRNDGIVQALVEQIREAAEEAEDAIDTYLVKRLRQQQQNFIGKIVHGPDHVATINKVVSKIESIKKQIDDIYRNKEQLGIDLAENVDDSQSIAELRRRRIEVEEADVVGFNNYARQLVDHLLDERKLDVISIIGMAGLGKTTLALKVFKDPQLRDHFSCWAWHHVSREYNIRNLVLDLLVQVTDITPTDQELEDQKLKEKLRQSLGGQRYFIVLDDIWRVKDWENLRACFPDDRNGSKILLTSRNIDIGTYASSTAPFCLPSMEEAESWQLFSKRVFRGETFPEDMVELGRRMCKDCNGLPLAILTLAGVLLTKKTLRSWSNIVEHVNWHLIKDPTRCSDILSLSYDDLPPHLKSCFLYFGVYPEGFNIPAKQIMQLWIAEGFVQNENNRKMEDMAEDYLEELIARSLVQVVSRGSDGRVKTCQIHDLLRDLCIVESTQGRFFEVYKTIATKLPNKPRRISIHSDTQYIAPSVRKFSCTRSFLCYDSNCKLGRSRWKKLHKSFKLIKVLDLGYSNVRCMPAKLINPLVYLRYLRLSVPTEYASPPSLSNLQHLQTLYMKGRFWRTIPDGFWKMTELRHFYVSGLPITGIPPCPSLMNLQTLTLVRAGDNLKHLICTGKFPMLTMLGLEGEKGRSWKKFLEKLYYLKHLQSLKIHCGKFELPDNLSNSFPSKLTKINLKDVSIEGGELRKLKKLANLKVIKIEGLYYRVPS